MYPVQITSHVNTIFTGCTGVTSLTVYGSGTMQDYTADNQPWNAIKGQLTSITVQNTVTSIGNYAFEDAVKITSFTIQSSITKLGNYAFHGCSKLTSIIFLGETEPACGYTQ